MSCVYTRCTLRVRGVQRAVSVMLLLFSEFAVSRCTLPDARTRCSKSHCGVVQVTLHKTSKDITPSDARAQPVLFTWSRNVTHPSRLSPPASQVLQLQATLQCDSLSSPHPSKVFAVTHLLLSYQRLRLPQLVPPLLVA